MPLLRKFELSDWNRAEIRIRPATTGSTPASPALTRANAPRRYSPRVLARISGATARSAWVAAASDCSSSTSTATTPSDSGPSILVIGHPRSPRRR